MSMALAGGHVVLGGGEPACLVLVAGILFPMYMTHWVSWASLTKEGPLVLLNVLKLRERDGGGEGKKVQCRLGP